MPFPSTVKRNPRDPSSLASYVADIRAKALAGDSFSSYEVIYLHIPTADSTASDIAPTPRTPHYMHANGHIYTNFFLPRDRQDCMFPVGSTVCNELNWPGEQKHQGAIHSKLP